VTLRDADDAAARAVTPTALRLALAALSAQGSGGGGGEGAMHSMADASEVLMKVYDALQAVSAAGAAGGGGGSSGAMSRMFGMAILEQARCTPCRKVSHVLRYTTFFHIVPSAALRAAHAAAPPGAARAFEALLARLQEGSKGCDKDAGGCGAPAPLAHVLERAPSVYTISLSWDTAQAPEAEVAATMAALGTALRPELLYYGGDKKRDADGARAYELRAMVCYYGSHYASFARTDEHATVFGAPPPAPAWTRFDDAAVTAVGGWQAVCDACARGHLQPTVLFYELADTCF
jgi:hypothetical protein